MQSFLSSTSKGENLNLFFYSIKKGPKGQPGNPGHQGMKIFENLWINKLRK